MALKLNIRPELEEEIDNLLPKANVRSKTEYINRAIEEYNQKLKRELKLAQLKTYFSTYRKEAQAVLSDFAQLKSLKH
jgi:metal-responsive CopG/Arc/MetJ family transcriptional regulator